MFYRSERLLLRPPWPEDWAQVYAEIADEAIVRNLSSAPWPYRREDARRFVNLTIPERFPRFLIIRIADAALVGCIGIDSAESDTGVEVELGYWIARRFWGQGFATEAGRSVLEITRMLGHQRIVASHFMDNPASGAVLRKLGFAQTGRRPMRFSNGRGEEAEVIEYATTLKPVIRYRGNMVAA